MVSSPSGHFYKSPTRLSKRNCVSTYNGLTEQQASTLSSRADNSHMDQSPESWFARALHPANTWCSLDVNENLQALWVLAGGDTVNTILPIVTRVCGP